MKKILLSILGTGLLGFVATLIFGVLVMIFLKACTVG